MLSLRPGGACAVLGHRIFPETTPDTLDLLYSVGFGALTAALMWRPATTPVSRWTPRPQPELGKEVLGPAIGHAEAELKKVIRAMPMSGRDRRAARRAMVQATDQYWGGRGLTLRNVHVPYGVRNLVRRLAVAADAAGRPLPEPELIELATQLLHWSTATAPYLSRHTEDVRRPAVDVGAPVRDAVTVAFARLLPEPLRESLELDRLHLHEVRVNLLRLDDRLYDELVERARRNAIAPDSGHGDGWVAVGGLDERVRREVIARLLVALRGGRPLSGEEFPNLARGPPQGVGLVRIVEDDLGDGGSLIAFGRHHREHAPHGVIVVPARVARSVEELIGADPAFADWWARLLLHELEFPIDGDEHIGDRHDSHAADLAAEYVDARSFVAAVGGMSRATRHVVEALLPVLAEQGHLRPLAEVNPLWPFGAPRRPVLVLEVESAGALLDGLGDALGRLVVLGWRARGALVVTQGMLDEIEDHLAAGRLAEDFWPELDGAARPEAAERLVERLEFARGFGTDLSAAGEVGFTAARAADGQPVWRLDTTFGTVVITGEQLSRDGNVVLSPAANAVAALVAGARWWLPAALPQSDRPARLLEMVATATRSAPIALQESGGLRVARVRFDEPVAVLQWQGGVRTRDVELVTWQADAGRHLLVGFYPVAQDSPAGLVDPDLLAASRRGVVAIRDENGYIVGTGWVVEAATESSPARLRTAYHVAELISAGYTVDRLAGGRSAITEVRSVPLAGYADLAELATAAQDYLDLGPSSARLPTLDVAEFTVWGLDRPAVPVRGSPVAPGELLTFIGFPRGIGLISRGPVASARRGLLETIAMLGGGASGGPGFDAQGRVVMTIVAERAGRVHGVGPELNVRFGERVWSEAGRAVPPEWRRQQFGRPTPSPAVVERALEESLADVEGLINELSGELRSRVWAVLDTLGGDPTQFLDHVFELLAEASRTAQITAFAERADAARAELERLHATAEADRAAALDQLAAELRALLAAGEQDSIPFGAALGALGIGPTLVNDAVERAGDLELITEPSGQRIVSRGAGGPVALGGMDSQARRGVIARLLKALRGARPLSGEEFPNLARGPPEGVALVRITEDDLGDGGSLIAFGWRHREHARNGVIVVPVRVARIVEQLIAGEPAFADWWARLLRHELEFHIDGTEHTGHRHDAHAAALAVEYDAVRRPIRTMTGGPSLVSHGDVAVDDRVRVEHLVAGLPVVEELAAGDPDLVRISGFTGHVFLQNPANGLRALGGLIEGTQALGIRGGLVVWASRDGWLYTDTRVLAALRADVLDPDARHALFDHELLHLSEPGLAESVIQDAAPLPDLTPLNHLYRDPAGFPVPAFRPVRDAYGRPAWLAPELGVTPGILSRVVRIVIHASDGYEHVGSGLLWSSDGRTGAVLTNRHVVADAERLWVELSTPAGVRSETGSVGQRPSADAIAAQLRASGAVGGLTDPELVQAADELDLAIVRIGESRRLAAPDLDRDGHDPRVTLLGFPRRQLPARSSAGGVDNLRTEARHLVIGSGLTARPPAVSMGPARKLDLFFVGPWAGPGNSGGPLITRTQDDEGVLVERVAGLYHARIRHKRIRTPIQAAVGAGAIEAFLRAAGVPAAGQGGGAVARHPLTDSQREQVVEALRASDEPMTPLEDLTSAMPRAPPGVSVQVRAAEFPAPGVVAFGWAERSVVVITRSTAAQIAARYARGSGWGAAVVGAAADPRGRVPPR